MLRRLLGLIIIVASIILIALLVLTALRVGPALNSVAESLDDVLTLTDDTLENTSRTLEQTRATVVEVNGALENAAVATTNLSLTMSDMQPLLESSATVVTEDIPGNIEAIQAAIPNITRVAGVIDDVLTRLSAFRIDQTIPIPFNPITLQFDLGIDYAPEEPFDASIEELGTSLEGMPEELRSLETDLDNLAADLELLTGNIDTAATDIEDINAEVALFIPIIDEYLDLISQSQQSLAVLQEQAVSQLQVLGDFLVFIFVLLAVTQIAPLYLGWELITGRRAYEADEVPVQEKAPPVVVQVSSAGEGEEAPQVEVNEKPAATDADMMANAADGEPTVDEASEPTSDAEGDESAAR